MQQNSLTHFIFILWLLLQLSVEINCQPKFIPKQRQWHTSTLVGSKLYILNGVYLSNITADINEFIYLDVSVPFNTKNLVWKNLPTSIVPAHDNAASAVGGVINNTIFLYGGYSSNANAMDLVYSFDTQSNTWNAPNIAEVSPIRKQALTGIVNNNGNMFLFGGTKLSNEDLNDMLILDTINLNWRQGSITNAPSGRLSYAAVLLHDQRIIYMGGLSHQTNGIVVLNLNPVFIYDTINDNWSTLTTSGSVPIGRGGFSAVLGLDGQRVIIFGGTSDPTIKNLASGDSLYELNLNNFEWSIPKTSGKIPSSRVFHRANVIGKYMVVSFGQGYAQSSENDILLLDISNINEYVWTSNFDLSSPTPSSSSNTSIIVRAVLGTFAGTLLLVGGFLLYRRNRKKQELNDQPQIPRSDNHDYNQREGHVYGSEGTPLPNTTNSYGQERNYNLGQEFPSTTNNERVSTVSTADINNIKNER